MLIFESTLLCDWSLPFLKCRVITFLCCKTCLVSFSSGSPKKLVIFLLSMSSPFFLNTFQRIYFSRKCACACACAYLTRFVLIRGFPLWTEKSQRNSLNFKKTLIGICWKVEFLINTITVGMKLKSIAKTEQQ